jgi:hypothetical protein
LGGLCHDPGRSARLRAVPAGRNTSRAERPGSVTMALDVLSFEGKTLTLTGQIKVPGGLGTSAPSKNSN